MMGSATPQPECQATLHATNDHYRPNSFADAEVCHWLNRREWQKKGVRNLFRSVPRSGLAEKTNSQDLWSVYKKKGSCHLFRDCGLLSAAAILDDLELPIAKAIHHVPSEGWGTVISCLPGELVIY